MKKYISSFLLLALTLNTCQTLAMRVYPEPATIKEKTKLEQVSLEQAPFEEIELIETIRENIAQTKTNTEILPKLYTANGQIPEDVIKHILLQYCDCETLQSFKNINKDFMKFVNDFVITEDLSSFKKKVIKKINCCNYKKSRESNLQAIDTFIKNLDAKIREKLSNNKYDSIPVLLVQKNGEKHLIHFNKENIEDFLKLNKYDLIRSELNLLIEKKYEAINDSDQNTKACCSSLFTREDRAHCLRACALAIINLLCISPVLGFAIAVLISCSILGFDNDGIFCDIPYNITNGNYTN
jgi:hypothetical protein